MRLFILFKGALYPYKWKDITDATYNFCAKKQNCFELSNFSVRTLLWDTHTNEVNEIVLVLFIPVANSFERDTFACLLGLFCLSISCDACYFLPLQVKTLLQSYDIIKEC